MLKEARIVMPFNVLDYETNHAAHTRLQEQLIDAFGGYTSFTGEGGWREPGGKLIEDYVIIYDVAIEAERDAPYDKLADIALEAGRALNQQSVYVRYPDGEAEIIECSKPSTSVKAEHMISALLFGLPRTSWLPETPPEAPVEPAAKPKLEPQPGELWETHGGGRVFVGKRATVYNGGWYATVVSGETSVMKLGQEYIIDTEGKALGSGSDGSPWNLKRRVN